MGGLFDHPGYLGLTSLGVIAIHADWPVYPAEHGSEVALRTLGQFPRDNSLSVVDSIDQCFLLRLDTPRDMKDPFYCAIWHKDALELLTAGFIRGRSNLIPIDWINAHGARPLTIGLISARQLVGQR